MNFPAINLRRLTGQELLYWVVEVNTSILALWCPTCWSAQVKDDTQEPESPCPRCGVAYCRLDEEFWKQRGRRIRRALRRDRVLLATVKADCLARRQDPALEHSPPYPLPEPLAWLLPLWRKAGQPKGRPVQAATYYRLAHAVHWLKEKGLPPGEIAAVIRDCPLDADSGKTLTEQARQRLSRQIRECVGVSFDRSDVWRALTWVQRQSEAPMSRLRGEQVKSTKSPWAPHGSRWGRLMSPLSGPTERDQHRFQMVSLWVRQESLSRDQAMTRQVQEEIRTEWMAIRHQMPHATVKERFLTERLPEWQWVREVLSLSPEDPQIRERLWQAYPSARRGTLVQEIDQSLQRVEQHQRAIATERGVPTQEQDVAWSSFWQPGAIKDQLERLRGSGRAGPDTTPGQE